VLLPLRGHQGSSTLARRVTKFCRMSENPRFHSKPANHSHATKVTGKACVNSVGTFWNGVCTLFRCTKQL